MVAIKEKRDQEIEKKEVEKEILAKNNEDAKKIAQQIFNERKRREYLRKCNQEFDKQLRREMQEQEDKKNLMMTEMTR